MGPRTQKKGPRLSPRPLPPSLGSRQAPIRKTLLPHFGHVPFMAGLPFFIVIFCGFWISTFILSLTQ